MSYSLPHVFHLIINESPKEPETFNNIFFTHAVLWMASSSLNTQANIPASRNDQGLRNFAKELLHGI
jgi:hypothetical protein